MSTKNTQNLQEVFLVSVTQAGTPVTVFLVNGIRLEGVISSFDQYSILLIRGGYIQLVFKQAVSTIMPMEPVTIRISE